MAEEIDGLLGLDEGRCARLAADSVAVRGYRGVDKGTGSISFPIDRSAIVGRAPKLALTPLESTYLPWTGRSVLGLPMRS